MICYKDFFFRTNRNDSHNYILHEIEINPHVLTAEQEVAEQLLKDLNQEIDAHAREKRRRLYTPIALALLGMTGIAIAATYWHSDKVYLDKQNNPDTWEKPCGDIIAAWNVQRGHGPYSPTVTCGSFINEDAPIYGIDEQCIEYCKKIGRIAVGDRFLEIIFGFIPSLSFLCCAAKCFEKNFFEECILSSDLRDRFNRFAEEQGASIDMNDIEALKAFCENILSRPTDDNTHRPSLQ